jgi:hypothetical protein
MRALSANEVLRVWDVGQDLHPLDRALTILRCASAAGEAEVGDPADLSVGERDALLLEVREATFGSALAMYARCPACDQQVELAMRTSDLPRGAGDRSPGGEDGFEITTAEMVLRFRLPASRDLGALLDEPGGASEQRLLARCLTSAARPDGTPVEVGIFPEQVVQLASAEMAARDRLGDVVLDLGCPSCGQRWQAPLDVAALLWTEIAASARRVLGEVAELARAFGWAEADILQMTAQRRHAYLQAIRQ